MYWINEKIFPGEWANYKMYTCFVLPEGKSSNDVHY